MNKESLYIGIVKFLSFKYLIFNRSIYATIRLDISLPSILKISLNIYHYFEELLGNSIRDES